MPELKHSFQKGRMNKDLDERLVPNGEYIDAMNIEVSTSEPSDVDTSTFKASLYSPFGTNLSSRSLFIRPFRKLCFNSGI